MLLATQAHTCQEEKENVKPIPPIQFTSNKGRVDILHSLDSIQLANTTLSTELRPTLQDLSLAPNQAFITPQHQSTPMKTPLKAAIRHSSSQKRQAKQKQSEIARSSGERLKHATVATSQGRTGIFTRGELYDDIPERESDLVNRCLAEKTVEEEEEEGSAKESAEENENDDFEETDLSLKENPETSTPKQVSPAAASLVMNESTKALEMAFHHFNQLQSLFQHMTIKMTKKDGENGDDDSDIVSTVV